MLSFPPKRWEVRYLKGMDTMTSEPPDAGEIALAAFLAIKPAGIAEGNFHFTLAGPDRLKIKFKITDVIDSRLFDGMFVEAELSVGDQIQFAKNTVCSDWSGIVKLVRSHDYMITDNEDDDISETFLATLEQHKQELLKLSKKADQAGICMRWILGTRGDCTDILLIAQVNHFNFHLDGKVQYWTILTL